MKPTKVVVDKEIIFSRGDGGSARPVGVKPSEPAVYMVGESYYNLAQKMAEHERIDFWIRQIAWSGVVVPRQECRNDSCCSVERFGPGFKTDDDPWTRARGRLKAIIQDDFCQVRSCQGDFHE